MSSEFSADIDKEDITLMREVVSEARTADLDESDFVVAETRLSAREQLQEVLGRISIVKLTYMFPVSRCPGIIVNLRLAIEAGEASGLGPDCRELSDARKDLEQLEASARLKTMLATSDWLVDGIEALLAGISEAESVGVAASDEALREARTVVKQRRVHDALLDALGNKDTTSLRETIDEARKMGVDSKEVMNAEAQLDALEKAQLHSVTKAVRGSEQDCQHPRIWSMCYVQEMLA
jgi:hypothetical protein